MPAALQTDATQTRIEEAVASKRCPICFLLRKDEFDELCRWVGQNIDSVANRARLDEAGGFCNHHFWLLTQLHSPYSGSLVNNYIAQKFLDLLRDRARADDGSLAGALRWMESRCPCCAHQATREAAHVIALVEWLKDAGNWEKYDTSFGLCFPHLLRVCALLANDAARARLADAQAGQLERLRQQMREYTRKFAARQQHHSDEPIGKEVEAWRQAVEKLVGRTNVKWP